MKQIRPTSAEINLAMLSHNLKQIRKYMSATQYLCPMVKANAYGHGDISVARHLEQEGVQVMGVGLVEEGILLRQNKISADILFFGMFDQSRDAELIVQHRLIPVLSSWDEIRCLEQVCSPKYPVQLKFDTGMHRLGFSLSEIKKLVGHFQNSSLVVQGILTHLHTAENANDLQASSFEQLRLFQEAEKAFRSSQNKTVVSHTLNSAGWMRWVGLKESGKMKSLPHGISREQGVRPGLALYGVSPWSTDQSLPANQNRSELLDLHPVLSLKSRTIKYHLLTRGEGVSYNTTWKASQDSVIAVVPMGYADGYHRLLSNRGVALFRGERVPVVGNVCMDYLMIDITRTLRAGELADSLKSEPVTLLGMDECGLQISANELAASAQTIPWEILTSIGERVPRVEVNS
ncbi:MAG: alanine racemase [Bdellovibrio sp. CG10_big_fil_rev_8_21_14_0_10_47_8]|nr:MAG: alanine racemase [Bdellovibrio sp. CG10_big_fil_rev_8_21_14_0_10_47_8]